MLRERVRVLRRRLDNPEVAAARRLMAQVRAAAPDVVHFGASESLFVAPYDTDQRTLPQLLAAELAPRTTYSVAGPGYHPGLFRAYLRHLAGQPARPTLVVGLAVRFGYPPWAQHPLYGYERAQRRLARRRGLRAALPLPTPAEMDALDRVAYPTLAGDLRIGDYRRALKESPDVARLYAYHHGARDGVGDAWLQDVRGLAFDAVSAGFPLVVYFMAIPVDRGVQLWGEPLREIAERDSAAAIAALPSEVVVVPSALAFGADDFIDPDDATEHLNERGRRQLAAMISSALG